jgi:hypothetical protein
MFVLNTVITVHFVLLPDAAPPIQSQFDIQIEDPLGNTSYTNNGLLTYTAPTANAQGHATYAHLVDVLGRWKFAMAVGDTASYKIYSRSAIFVTIPVIGIPVNEINRHLTTSLGDPV